jgi:hypothetical protein
MQAGLSFDQAPPFAVPLRFFLTAPLFLLAAALLMLFSPESLSSRWTPQALALTHALTLGFLAMTMIGALMQMLPVVAGAVVPAGKIVAWLIHVPLASGTAALMAGFMGAGSALMLTGTVLLAAGLALFLAAAGISLARALSNATVGGIRLAVISFGLTVLLGVALALLRAGFLLPVMSPIAPLAASTAHVAFGLAGWVLLLVIGVAYQVVPMFQITPPYPPRLARWLAGAMFILLLAQAAASLLPHSTGASLALIAETGLAAGMLVFALATLELQAKRRRKLPDITLDFWRMGMASLILCVAAWLSGQVWPAWRENQAYPLLLGVLFIGGFAVSVVNGMLYKIVPFLAWFHLQAQLQARAGTIPNMKQMIAEKAMRIQFRLHLLACGLFAAAAFSPLPLSSLAGAAMALSSLLLWVNLLSATRRYARHGGSFV